MLLKYFSKIIACDYKIHLYVALVIRFVMIIYGIRHDHNSEVPYTDVDYKVYTDAARHILQGESPYNRHTYRYTPLLAFLLIPNLLMNQNFGKFLFCLFDIIDAILIRRIIVESVTYYQNYKNKKERIENKTFNRKQKKTKQLAMNSNDTFECSNDYTANMGMVFWLYNPMTVAISTRGNCDSLAGFLVLLTLYSLQTRKNLFISGLIYGISIHFRLYPIVFCLTFFMYLSRFAEYTTEDRRVNRLKTCDNKTVVVKNSNEKKTIFKKKYLLFLIPNLDQLLFIFGTVLSLFDLTMLFYYLYGDEFLHETYLYHFVRKDTRHNFSLYFYLQYLTAGIKSVGFWQKILMVLPQMVLLLVFSVRYGLNRFALNFAVLVETIVFVIFNSVITSQYFVWIMVVLPLCLWQLQITAKSLIVLGGIWFAAQLAWLLPAYFLEFHGKNTFIFIWVQSVSLFCAHIAILGRFVTHFGPK